MEINLEKVMKCDREKLELLMQLYLHDISYYFPIDFCSRDCKYHYDLDKYFVDNYAYFIKNDNDILGFILIDDNHDNNYEISEIFVLNNYKKKGIAEATVFKVFDMYRGNWMIKAVPLSDVASSFWKRVVSKYTADYKIDYTGKYKRLEISFSNFIV